MTQLETLTTELNAIEQPDLLVNRPEIERFSQVGFDPEKLIPQQTYVEAGIEKLTALSEALGMADKTAEMVTIFRGMTASWGDKKVGDTSGWQSDVSNDLSPFEFSIAFKENRAELRVLLEAQGKEPTLESNWQAGLELNQYLTENYNVNLDRFEQIKDLYVPTNPDSKLAIWHSVCFFPDKDPEFKLYLNPQAQGGSKAAAVVEESLVRLGFTHAWIGLAEVAAQRGSDKDQFVYFSLDLATNSRSRVKVYLRHYDATAEDLEKALSLAQNYVSGDATEFCEAMAKGHEVFAAKPAISCFSWVEGDNHTPAHGTIHLPISHYAINDRVVKNRLDRYLADRDLPVSVYSSTLQAFAQRSLELGNSLHSYISFRREKQQERVTIYLNPEVNNTLDLSRRFIFPQEKPSCPFLKDVVHHYEEETIANHPLLQRLQREAVNPQHLWLLLMNVQEAVVTHFARRLANIIARIEDERINCMLVKQLNEELGNGDTANIHRLLFEKMLTAIDSWKMENFTEQMLAPGKEFSDRLEEIYLDENPYLGVGAAIIMEIQGKQFDLCLGKQFRRIKLDLTDSIWLTMHEELEIDHAHESLLIANLVDESRANVETSIQGIKKTRMASWHFLDRIYQICFG